MVGGGGTAAPRACPPHPPRTQAPVDAGPIAIFRL